MLQELPASNHQWQLDLAVLPWVILWRGSRCGGLV